ncbi:hypothetical protein GOBAR_AA00847 [Gossypium barbadense]|uniref:Uncharacterized protein n=1 Tax=Gossypium barbadense TaxID=3634 RepID=A0A2P5YVT8_GOSBA|nr:hypothetical protein GOBAR_AA00847 [Gossypium barbadense]
MCKPNLEPNPPLEVKSPIDSRHLIRWSMREMCEPDLESNPPHEVKHPIASRHLERWSTREMCEPQDGSPYRYDNLARCGNTKSASIGYLMAFNGHVNIVVSF